jgi:hypothetical protein
MEAGPIPHRGTGNQPDTTGFIRLNCVPRGGIAKKVQKINMKLFNQTCLAIFLAIPMAASAQTEDKSAPPIQVNVGDVTDNRTTSAFNSECKVELKLTGDAAADAQSVRRVQLVEATDSTGRDLIPKKDDEMASHFMGFGQSSGALSTEVKLRNPSRNATAIKVLKGQVELFNPTEANGGVLTIKGILQHPAEPVQNPALAKYHIQLMYLTKQPTTRRKRKSNPNRMAISSWAKPLANCSKACSAGWCLIPKTPSNFTSVTRTSASLT